MQARPKTLALASLAVMAICVIPFFALRLDSSDAGNDPTNTSTYRAFNMLSHGFGAGFNGPLLVAVEMPSAREAVGASPGASAPLLTTPPTWLR